ncbi:hypothetical protein A5893_04730 [Pedobacter psychrophilus]|uniref:Uncharacterized protein n=2 Tax=Pedobacter psychrophilus TaxID=1826909 RepID=A0A179DHI7_9SPHI|nr:hypothetical protein A5893_04730 [Pedobacter psychrophilus]
MLDKDFDQLFKSSFEDFEVQPAANSWDKITDGLDRKPKRKNFGIFWMAAASVVVVLGIGIGLYTKPTEVIKLRGNTEEVLSQAAKEQNNDVENVDVENTKSETDNNTKNNSLLANNQSTKKINKNNLETHATISNTSNVSLTKDTENELSRIVATKPIRTKTVTERILEEEASKNLDDSKIKTQTLLAQNTIDENLEEDGYQSNRRQKIKSVGDLVNFVVAKVDKREEKIIKVSKTDESDNEITGINLGLFRFRKID